MGLLDRVRELNDRAYDIVDDPAYQDSLIRGWVSNPNLSRSAMAFNLVLATLTLGVVVWTESAWFEVVLLLFALHSIVFVAASLAERHGRAVRASRHADESSVGHDAHE